LIDKKITRYGNDSDVFWKYILKTIEGSPISRK